MKLKYLFLLFLVGYGLAATAQSIDEIKDSRDCFYGEGVGRTIEEADRMALDQLMQKVFVMTDYPFDMFDYDERAFLSLYRNAFNKESQRMLVEEKEYFYKICRFIHINDIERVFEARKEKVKEYCQHASHAETELRIDDALRNYYWASCLLTTLPNSKRIVKEDEKFPLSLWLQKKQEEILTGIEIQKVKEVDSIIVMAFTYKDQPVTSLCYSYIDGRNFTQLYKATDGLGAIKLTPGYVLDTIVLNVECQFYDRVRRDDEIEAVLSYLQSNPFYTPSYLRTAMHRVAINVPNSDDYPIQPLANPLAGLEIGSLSEVKQQPYENTMHELVKCLRSNDLKQAENCFSPQSEDLFIRFKYMGKIHVIDEPRLCYLPMGEAVLCLGLPVFVEMPRRGLCFVEYLSFVLGPDAKIRRFAFGIDQKTTVELLGNGNYMPSSRLAILNLLEAFKTAYPLVQFEFICKLIDEAPASSVVPVADTTYLYPFEINQKQVESNDKTIQYRKNSSYEYLKRLRRGFGYRDFVESDLRNISVMKMVKGGELYGIQFDVEYSSPNCSDSGNLLLLLDLNDPEKIQIKFNLWQEESLRGSLSTKSFITPSDLK